MARISRLDLSEGLRDGGLNFTDEGLKEVAKLQNLKWLSLQDTDITDTGLDVAKLENLTTLACTKPKSPTRASRRWPS